MKPSENPFRASAIEAQRYRICTNHYAELLRLAHQKNYRACLRGAHGTGKSTLLLDIATSLELKGEAVCWHYLNRQMPWPQKFKALRAILKSDNRQLNFLDGGEVVGFAAWLLFIVLVKIKRKTLLATTHALCPLPTIYTTRSDEGTMLSLTQAFAGGCWSEPLRQLALHSYAQSGGNYREVIRVCYLHCSELRCNATLTER